MRPHLSRKAPQFTAGSLAVLAPTVAPTDRVSDLAHKLTGHAFGTASVFVVVDAHAHVLGTVHAERLWAAHPDDKMSALAETNLPRVLASADREQMAHLALRKNVSDIVVTRENGQLVGVVPALSLMRVLYREHEEDLHKLAGIAREDADAVGALTAPPRRRARDRLPWLLVGLAGSAIATWVTSRFETTLQARVAVGFFIPGLVYLADAVGTQTEAIVVRALAHEEHQLSAGKLLRGEVSTAFLIGTVLAGLVLPAVWWTFSDLRLAVAVALSLFVATIAAASIGLMLPWILHRRGIDPAFGSGPLATVLQDVLTLGVYLAAVRALLAT